MLTSVPSCIINENLPFSSVSSIPNTILNKHPLMFYQPDESVVCQMAYQFKLLFFGDNQNYLRVSDDQIASFVQNDAFIECAHQILVATLNDPLSFGAHDIDDYSVTFNVPRKILLKAMDRLDELERLVDCKARYVKGGGKLYKHYSKRMICRLNRGGIILLHFDPTAEDTREARIAIKRSSMDSKSWHGFMTWLIDCLGHDFIGTLDDANNTRLDTGFTIYGMPYTFLLVKDNCPKSLFLYKDKGCSIPTSELLNTSGDSNSFKTYDPSLYRWHKIPEDERSLILPSSRIERKKEKTKSGGAKPANDATKFPNLLRNRSQHNRLKFVSPRIFKFVNKRLAVKLVKYRLNNIWKHVTDKESEDLAALLKSGAFDLSLNKECWRDCESTALSQLQREILGKYDNRHLQYWPSSGSCNIKLESGQKIKIYQYDYDNSHM